VLWLHFATLLCVKEEEEEEEEEEEGKGTWQHEDRTP
jgi:hypothetical protein